MNIATRRSSLGHSKWTCHARGSVFTPGRCEGLLFLRLSLFLWLLIAGDSLAAADEPTRPNAALGELDEEENDRVQATVYLLQARLAQDRGNLQQALRRYQRAWRYAPEAVPLLQRIVALAFELKRNDEAARYAVISAERAPSDPSMLRSLALLLAQQRNWPRALSLYESAARLEARQRSPDDTLEAADLALFMELGRLYYLTGQFGRSAESFATVRSAIDSGKVELTDELRRTLLGESGEAFSLWAEASLSADRFAEAEQLFRRANEASSDPALLAWQLARVEAAQGNPSSARRFLEQYFDSKSIMGGSAPYELFAEQVAIQNTEPSKARQTIIDRFEQLRLRDPENFHLLHALARQYIVANQLERAETILASLAAREFEQDVARDLVAIYRRQSKLERLTDVLADFALRTGAIDGLAEAGTWLIDDRATVLRLVAQTRTKLRGAGTGPRNGELFAVGLVALEAKEWTAAEELLSAASKEESPGKETVMLRWGLAMMLAEQYPRAAGVFQQVVEDQTTSMELALPYYYLAAALEMSGQHESAIAAARKGAELAPDEPQMAIRPAWILNHAGKDDEARQAYLTFVKDFDERQHSRPIRQTLREARLALSSIELRRGDVPAAVEWLEQVLDEFPEDLAANNDLGYLWADRGIHLRRAQRMVEFAVKRDPDNTAFRDSLGWVYFRLGRYDDAVRELKHAASSKDGQHDGVILDHLGDALLASGSVEDARTYWRRAETAFQQDDNAIKSEAIKKKREASMRKEQALQQQDLTPEPALRP